MDPRLLFNILFDVDPEGKDWICEKNEKDFLQKCENKVNHLTINWTERKGRKKTIEIDHPSAKLQMNLNSFQPKVVERENLFSLSAPPGFKSYRIR